MHCHLQHAHCATIAGPLPQGHGYPQGCLHAAEALTDDHKPSRNDEHDRVEEAGGAVIWAGTWRVSGVLAVSRAFGDRPLKKYVISTPDVSSRSLTDTIEEHVVLASDGLFDVFSNRVRTMAHCNSIYVHESVSSWCFGTDIDAETCRYAAGWHVTCPWPYMRVTSLSSTHSYCQALRNAHAGSRQDFEGVHCPSGETEPTS